MKNLKDMTLEELIKAARHVEMTPQDREEQRINWAFGNVRLANPNITREMVVKAARKLDEK